MMMEYINRIVNLTDPSKNVIYNMTPEEATEMVMSGDADRVREIDGQFGIIATEGKTVRLARSLGRPLRYFIAKLKDGPCLILAERIDSIHSYLRKEGLDDQFHPSYTRMVPAHYITTIELLGCPDPGPGYKRFFTPEQDSLMNWDLDQIGKYYVGTLYNEIEKWLTSRAATGPIGVTFSAGVDSGSVFLLTYHALMAAGESPSRLKAFTLCVDDGGEDLKQAREFLKILGLEFFLEPIDINSSELDWRKAVKIVEDYKPLDIQAATMNLALMEGIRSRYPGWKYIIDGEGGDENLKDYPIEENAELTIRSILGNPMLYHEGWGVDKMKHSLTYTGGLSRGYMRSYMTSDHLGFENFSPYTLRNVIEIAEGIPFKDLTNWDHQKLYDLKGRVVAAGIEAITGMKMPVYNKRRFQHGAASGEIFCRLFPRTEAEYRKVFNAIYEQVT